MARLPLEERRQIFLVRQRANQAMLDQLLQSAPAQALSSALPSHRLVGLVVKAVILVMLVGLGFVAYQNVTLHPPTSVVEALLPRL